MPSRSNATRRAPLFRTILLASLLFQAPLYAQVTTSMSSGSASGGQSVALNIVASTTGTVQPAALEWTIAYPTADVSSMSVQLGPSGTAAAKSVTCAANGAATTCIVDGLNQSAIPNGTVAVVTLQIAPAPVDSSFGVQISGLVAAGPDGSAISDTGAGGTVTVIPAIPQAGLICASSTVDTPGSLSCTVSLNATPQASSGFAINLATNNAALQVPASVVVPAGAASASFTAQATSVGSDEEATVTATGASNSPSVSLSLMPPVQAPPPPCTSSCADTIAINGGGSAAGSFVADADYQGGSVYAANVTINTTGVTNPAPQSVYQSERFGNFTYTIPALIPGAAYTVRLHFAEIYWKQAGQRVFNVSINGTAVLKSFDIIGAAGAADTAIVEQFNVAANPSGKIVIQFATIKDNAKISGIEVRPVASAAINAGGNAGTPFMADTGYSGGSEYGVTNVAINTAGVTNPAPQAVYQSERFGNFTYTVPGLTPGAAYTVRLHFAEIYWSAPGQRIFDVTLNGAAVLSNFDIIATAGGPDIAVIETFGANANATGQVVIQFTTIKDNAKVSGIEVLPASS